MSMKAFRANRIKNTAKCGNPREIPLSPRNTLLGRDLLVRGRQVNDSFLSYRLNAPFWIGTGKGLQPFPEGRDQVEESYLLGQLQGLLNGESGSSEPVEEENRKGYLKRAWIVALFEWLLQRHERARADEGAGPGSAGASFYQAAPSAEKCIWNHNFAREGLRGTQRGRILEWMYGVPWRSNTKDYDLNSTNVQQIKSTRAYHKVAGIVRSATRDAAGAILNDRTGTMKGRRAQTVIITPTDAPAHVDEAIRSALDPQKCKNIPDNAAPPEHVRGLPGKIGTFGYFLTGIGLALTTYGLVADLLRGDIAMALGDSLGVAGGAFELYALLSPGAVIAGMSILTAVTAGIALSGAGIAVTSAVSLYRAWKRKDVLRTMAGVAGVAAGVAITVGITGIAASLMWAPLVLGVGACTAFGVGVLGLILGVTLRESKEQPGYEGSPELDGNMLVSNTLNQAVECA